MMSGTPSGLTLWRAVVVVVGVLSGVDGFIFPDLKALRTGNRFQSRYKIAVLQEVPFLSDNGTGYVPDLLRLVADWYSTANPDGDVFAYDVLPVETWNQLLTKASATHWQISFGLISSSLTKTENPWKSMHYSHSAVHSGLQLVGSSKAKPKTQNKGSAAIRQMAPTTTTPLPIHSPDGHQLNINGFDIRNATLLALDGSPEAHMLQRHSVYRHQLKTVRSNDEALGHILRHPNSFLLKDSAVADKMEEQFKPDLASICKTRGNIARTVLHHGFFGRDATIVSFFNSAFKKLRTAEKDQMKILNRKYFGHLRTCPY